MNAYKYEVLGGHHTTTARLQLHKHYPDNQLFSKILAEVYVGLSDDEALRLSSRHNANGHFIHRMTHKDYVRKKFLIHEYTLMCTYLFMRNYSCNI